MQALIKMAQILWIGCLLMTTPVIAQSLKGETVYVKNTTDSELSISYAYEKTRGNMVSDTMTVESEAQATLVENHALAPQAFLGMYPQAFDMRARIYETGNPDNIVTFNALIRHPGSVRTYIVERNDDNRLHLNVKRSASS